MASVVEEDEMTRYQKAEKVAKAWSTSDEKEFQKLLKRRRSVAERTLKALGDVDVDSFAEALVDGYDAISAWDDFVENIAPFDLIDQLDYAGVFEDDEQ